MIIIYVAVFVIIFFLIFSCVLIITNKKLKERDFRFLLLILVLSLGIIAYATVPSYGTDLSRYYVELNLMRKLGVNYAFQDSLYHITPLANLLFYIVSRTNINNLLPFFASIIIFSFLFFINYKILREFNIPQRYFYLFFFLFIAICSLRAMLTGVRQGLACSFVASAVFFDFFYKREKISIILYLCGCLIHMGILPVIIVRLLFIVLKNSKLGFVIIFWGCCIPLFDFLMDSSNEYFKKAYDSLMGYSEAGYPDMRLLYAKTIVFCIIIILLFVIKWNKSAVKYNDFFRFYEFLICFTIGAYPVMHLYERMLTFLTFISIPVLYKGFSFLNQRGKIVVTAILSFMIFGLIMYWCVDLKTSWRLTTYIYN